MKDAIQKLQCSINSSEKIIWKSKPNKKCFVLESIFNPMLPIAIVWLIVDLSFIFAMKGTSMPKDFSTFLALFFSVHLFPVWIYLFGVIFTFLRFKNIAYIITDHNIYISSGLFSYIFVNKSFAELNMAEMHRGIFDQLCGCGDVRFSSLSKSTPNSFAINNIKDYEEIYKLVIKLQEDVHSDVSFPNAYRPSSNPGYNPKITDNQNIADLINDVENKNKEQ